MIASSDSGDRTRKLLKQLDEIYTDRLEMRLPGFAVQAKEAQQQEAGSFGKMWASVFGDPDDPEVKAKIAAMSKAVAEKIARAGGGTANGMIGGRS